jgi:ADP-ribose pyrophosphatase
MPKTHLRELSHAVVFRGRVFHVERDRVRLGHGRTTVLDIVRHRGSVVLIPQPDAAHVILIRQYRHAIGRWIWELPAGSLEPGEAPARAAKRECAEEIGLVPGRVDRLAAYYPTPGFCDERMTFYRCSDLSRPVTPVAGDPDEEIRPRTCTLAEVDRLISRRLIVDMKTVVGMSLIRAARRRR